MALTPALNNMPLPQVGETISKEEFEKLPAIGETITAEEFEKLGEQPKTKIPPSLISPFAYGTEQILKFGADVLSRQKQQEWYKSIVQETVGGRGIAGVGALPGRVAETALAGKTERELYESKSELADLTTQLIKRARTNPAEKERLMKIARENMNVMNRIDMRAKELEKRITTPGEAMGTTLRAEATAVAMGAPPATSVGMALETGVMAGALRGLATATEDELPLGEGLARIALESALTGITFMAGYGIKVGAGKVWHGLTKKTPDRLYKSALRQSTQELKRELHGRAPELSKQLLAKGIKGSENKIYTQSVVAVNQLEQDLNRVMTTEGTKTLSTSKIAHSLDELTRQYRSVLGEQGVAVIQSVRRNVIAKGKEISLKTALQFKRDIYRTLSNRAFNVDAALSQKAEALRTVAHSIMKNMAKTSPAVDKIAKQQEMWIRTAQAVETKLVHAGRANILGLNDVIMATGGMASGKLSSVVAGVGRRTLEATAAKTYLGFGIDRTAKAIEKLPTDKVGRVAKTAVMDLINRFISNP